MLIHEGEGGGIRDALQAENLDQPVEQGRGVVSPNRRDNAPVSKAVMQTGEVAGSGSDTADTDKGR